MSNLNNSHNDYHRIGVSTTDFRDKIVHGHPPGGVAIFWHISIEQYIKPIDIAVDWCVAVEFNIGIKKFVVLNVYLPYQCAENEETYLEDLGEINAILQELDNTCYVVVGDWNADLRNVQHSLFAAHMLNFCSDNNLVISTRMSLPDDSYSFVSDGWRSLSWLDHAVSSLDFYNVITNISICYDLTDEDHIPFTMLLDLDKVPELATETNCCSPRLHWENLSDSDCIEYGNKTDELLQQVQLPDVVNCTNIDCHEEKHINEIKHFYDNIIAWLQQAGNSAFSNWR